MNSPTKGCDPYPGSTAEVTDIIDLAEAYYDAANALIQAAKKRGRLSYAPARFVSIHAIELFLNAFLRHHGAPPEEVRGRLHNLSDDGFRSELKLRKKTAQHLVDMTQKREYLISRYAPEQVAKHTELTRLNATLKEIRKKTLAHLQPGDVQER